MTDKTVKVGDVVAWDEVPSGAMVACCFGHKKWRYHYAMRIGVNGDWVGMRDRWESWVDRWTWKGVPGGLSERPVIVGSGLTGNETADELRALAEAFERELRALAEAFEREHPAT